MTDHNEDRQIDELLDSLLSEYSNTEPRPGLETRILASLQDAGAATASRRWNMQWLWAGAAIAAVALFAAVFMGRHHAAPSPKDNIVHVQQPPQQPREVQPRGPEKAAGSFRRPPLPQGRRQPQNSDLALNRRPPIFPTPVPLSEQEQLLLRYVAGTPREELIAQSHPEEPPVIDPDQSQAIPDLSHVPQTLSNTQ
jgi:hypothetical protein